ncbi:MAG: hypothetical protein PHV34_19770 [Verrucomicrobiae bacterium]|nr:hypothetical protein [Verrucomicrobiae bacterium]
MHLNLDDAATAAAERLGLESFDAREWGASLRFCVPEKMVERFFDRVKPHLAPCLLAGSGDFHHLTALWLRRIEGDFTLFSFDNHPDWDVRPPRWSCGGWINRAMENGCLKKAVVWGCGNFELAFPGRIWASGEARAGGRLEIRPWNERLSARDRVRYRGLDRSTWRGEFEREVEFLRCRRVYATVDLDCLAGEWAACNWENGLFDPDDLVWALGLLRARTEFAGGDVCGAFSPPRHARWGQRLAAAFDHPRLEPPTAAKLEQTSCVVEKIWQALIGG